MIGYDGVYNKVEGLNPFDEEIKDRIKGMESTAKSFKFVSQLAMYFSTFPEVTSDDVESIKAYSNSVTFRLAVKDSKFVHSLAQFTGLKFVKSPNYDGQSIQLTASVPEDHPLAAMDVLSVFVTNYLPTNCKVVVKEHKPLAEAEREMYLTLLREGKPVFGTSCSAEEEETPVGVESAT